MRSSRVVAGKKAEMTSYAFMEFELDGSRGELFRDGERVAISGPGLHVLALLAQRAGRLVTLRDLEESVWKDRNVDIRSSAHTAIRHIRKALGDDAKSPRFVRTVPREGYIFMPAVRVVDAARAQRVATVRRGAVRFALVIVGVAIIVALGLFGRTRGTENPEAGEPAPRLDPELVSSMRGAFEALWSGDLDSAESRFASQARSSPYDVEANAGLALVLLERAYAEPALTNEARLLLDAAHDRAPASSYVQSSLGRFRLFFDLDLDAGTQHLTRALDLFPENDEAHIALAYFHAFEGDLETAVRHAELAAKHNPSSAQRHAEYGIFLGRARKFDASRRSCSQAWELDPGQFKAAVCQFFAAWHLADLPAVKRWGLRLVARRGEPRSVTTQLSMLDGDAFFGAFWELTANNYRARLSGPNPPPLIDLALALANTGEKDLALDTLERSLEDFRSYPYFLLIGVDPHVDALRNSARFQNIQSRIVRRVTAD